jgi:hypothetical protein
LPLPREESALGAREGAAEGEMTVLMKRSFKVREAYAYPWLVPFVARVASSLGDTSVSHGS